MIALLVIDMQVGLFEGDPPRHDADGVIRRINEIAKVVRATGVSWPNILIHSSRHWLFAFRVITQTGY